MQYLEALFSQAGLVLQLENKVLNLERDAVSNGDSFQVTINHSTDQTPSKPFEFFRMYLGHPDNQIKVLDTNRRHKQILIFIKEPAHKHILCVWNQERECFVKRHERTHAFEKKLICGYDQFHLFVAELPKWGLINTVADAHRVLMPSLVRAACNRNVQFHRQGEWFFIPLTPSEKDFLKERFSLRHRREGHWARRININVKGHAHVVEEIYACRGPSNESTVAGQMYFAQGHVWHFEHETLYLDSWHRVVHNTEPKQLEGIRWPERVRWDD